MRFVFNNRNHFVLHFPLLYTVHNDMYFRMHATELRFLLCNVMCLVPLPSNYSLKMTDALTHSGVTWVLHNRTQTDCVSQWISERRTTILQDARRQSLPSAILSTTDATRTDPRSAPSLCGKTLATDNMSHYRRTVPKTCDVANHWLLVSVA